MRILLLSLLIAVLFTQASATIPWTPEDAERARAARGGERVIIPAGPYRFSGVDLADFALAAQFVASMQVGDTLDPEYGGIREGEHLPNIIQTDNTSESIWFFSRLYEITGDASILDNLDASWTYVLNHPAYNEEGGDDAIGGYYRMYNCGWALRAEMKYREVFDDTTYKAYSDSCARYLNSHNLRRTGITPFYDAVNPGVLAWAAGNLYEYAVRAGNETWRSGAVTRGIRVKNWVEGDSTVLGTEEWAMSGGAVMWGLLESYFRENPAEESAWVATYASQMDTIADPGDWENAWNGWYALGEKRLEQSTGEPRWGNLHAWMTDYLRAFDTENDGGIQAQPSDGTGQDQAWVTSYLAFMGFDPLLQEATDVTAAAEPAPGSAPLLLANRPNPFNPETWIPFRLKEPSAVVLDIYDIAGRKVLRLVDESLPAGEHTVRWAGCGGRGEPVPSGVYFYRIHVGRYSETHKMLLVR